MPVALNHHIVHARDPEGTAHWTAELLGLDPPRHLGPFWEIKPANDLALDYMHDDDPQSQHYAFLVSEDEFTEILGRITTRGIDHYADHRAEVVGEINHHDGGRGTYFFDPEGHFLEIITRPYGWAS